MSILIKGIDLPKSGDRHRITIYDNGNAYITTTVSPIYETEIKDVEVIQIPASHGRLIDLDDIYIGRWDIDSDLAEQIQNAPTILEAEERTYTIQADSETVSYKNGENQF